MPTPSPRIAPQQGLVVSASAVKEDEGGEGQGKALVIISKRNKPSGSLNASEPRFGEAALQGPPAQGILAPPGASPRPPSTQSLSIPAGWDRAYPQARSVGPKPAPGRAQHCVGSLGLGRAKSCMLQAGGCAQGWQQHLWEATGTCESILGGRQSHRNPSRA